MHACYCSDVIFVEVQVNFQLTSVSVAEGSGVFDFTLNISNAVGSTTVSLSSMSGSASNL